MGLLRAACAAALLIACMGHAAAAPCDAARPVEQSLRSIHGSASLDGTQAQPLPDTIARELRNERVRISYELDVSGCADAPAAALWLFRVGGPYRISAGGRPLELLNNSSLLSPHLIASPWPLVVQGLHNGRMPALFALPPGARSIVVELQTQPYFPSGISRALLGPTNLMLPVQAQASELVNAWIDQASVVLLLLGLIALLLWVARRGDPSLLWLAVACGLWGLRGILYFGGKVYVEPSAFEQYNSLNVVLTSAALCAAILHLFGGMRASERAWLLWGTALCVAVYLATLATHSGAALARALFLGSSFVMVVWLLWRAWHGRASWTRWHLAVLTGCLATLLGCGVHDILLLAGALPPDAPSYLFWGFVVLLSGMALVSGHYVVLTLRRAERSNEELELHVARKTDELEHSYARLRTSEQEAARAQERERLLRDMHDGLGAQLMTALRGVERGALAPQQIVQSLQDSLDELRLLMDSTDMGHYLPGALAAWRNRWDARLAAAGVTLDWRIDESLDQVQLSSEEALQVMRILQEAATNVVKHSQAARMSLDARVLEAGDERQLCITIEDDGIGLPQADVRAGARGLKNMRFRAGQIGGILSVASRAPAGCRVRLTLSLRA